MILVLIKEHKREILIERTKLLLAFIFTPLVNLQDIVEWAVVFCIRKERHLVPLVVKPADFGGIANAEKAPGDLRAIAKRAVVGQPVYERLLVGQDVVADTKLLKLGDLTEFLLNKLRV